MKGLGIKAFFIAFVLCWVSSFPSLADRDFVGDVKSLLPQNYRHSLDDFEEEDGHASVMDEYQHALLPDVPVNQSFNRWEQENEPNRPPPNAPYIPRWPNPQIAPERVPIEPRFEGQDQGNDRNLGPVEIPPGRDPLPIDQASEGEDPFFEEETLDFVPESPVNDREIVPEQYLLPPDQPSEGEVPPEWVPSHQGLSAEQQTPDTVPENDFVSQEMVPSVPEEVNIKPGIVLDGTSLDIPPSVLEEANRERRLEASPENIFPEVSSSVAKPDESNKEEKLAVSGPLDVPPAVDSDSAEVDLEALEVKAKRKHPWLILDMMSVGLEGGVVSSMYPYTSSVGIGSHGSYGARQGALGLRFTLEKLIKDQWVAGMTGSFRYTLGNVEASHGALNAFSQSFKTKNTQRYEVAGKLGRTIGSLHPYVKAGVVSSLFLSSYSDSTLVSSPKEKFLWGGTAGLGMDVDIAPGLLLGGVMEYDYYNTYRGNLSNSAGTRDTYKVSPRLANLMMTLTWKLDRFRKKE